MKLWDKGFKEDGRIDAFTVGKDLEADVNTDYVNRTFDFQAYLDDGTVLKTGSEKLSKAVIVGFIFPKQERLY